MMSMVNSVALTVLLAGPAQALVWNPFASSPKGNASESLALDPKTFTSDVSASCSSGRDLSKWASHASIQSMIDAWQEKVPEGGIVMDDGASRCMAAGSAAGGKVLSIVEKPEDAICHDNTDHHTNHPERLYHDELFAVKSDVLKKLGNTRKYMSIWPKEGTCTKQTPCPVVLFFHGCGGFLPYLQFAMYDNKCYDELKSVIVFPKLKNGKGEGDESWTGDGTEVLDKFVMPLWEEFAKDNADVIDADRVMVMGESLGTGMALQAGLSYPDIFSAVVATGLTTGDSCESVDDFKIDKVLPKKSDRAPSKLKTVVATFAERERLADQRVTRVMELLETAGVDKQVSVHFRVLADVGHIDSILMTQNTWKALYDGVWKGDLA